MKISEFVKKYDPTFQFDVLKNSWKQVEYAESIEFNFKLKKVNSVIVCGMGGSAISGDLLRNTAVREINVPYFVNRSYSLPSFAGPGTLVIISSYSGNTEESISVLKEALDRKCSIICITTGGTISKFAEEHKLPCIKLKSGLQPRYALGQSFFTLLRLMEYAGIISPQKDFISEVKNLWGKRADEYSLEDNAAINYAGQLVGFIPVIYSAIDFTDAVGYRFKCQLNENSKIHCFHNVIPEMNHNEIIGWESFNQKDFRTKIINLIDKKYPEQVMKRFRITSGLISSKDTEIINLESDLENFKIRLFDLIYLTDWITYYLAVLRGFDPVEIDYINMLKKRLS